MNLLLDTHVIIWWLNNSKELSSTHRKHIEDMNNLCYISSATTWEISIKSQLGKITIPNTYIDELKKEGFRELPIRWSHTNLVKTLPEIHKDPFDRILIAQAKIENMILLTNDQTIKKYPISFL
ncbi:MAG: type II toxin-antitoxin system VapC family toxin [Candidatus Marinimicrobia bacterium]|nr:type II toxin-antitoxin system VapC family toxin [Candidatus Neomarinimicrobiota bacterium]